MTTKCAAEKPLRDGEILRLNEWISDFYAPGQKMRSLQLVIDGKTVTNFPSRFEEHASAVQKWYAQIQSVYDFAQVYAEVEHADRAKMLEFIKSCYVSNI